MRFLFTIFAALLALLLASAQDAPPPLATATEELVPVPSTREQELAKGGLGERGRSVSRSRQFIVHGKSSTDRGVFCVFCEDVKTELLTLLGHADAWRYPIVIQLRGDSSMINVGSPVRPAIRLVEGGGFHLQLTVDFGDAFTWEIMRKELIGVLLAESILRANPAADFSRKKRVLPEWLRLGVAEAVDFRRLDRPTDLFFSIYKSGKMLTVTEILHADASKMHSVSRSIYEASCCGLVLALVGRDNGPERMRNLLADLPVFRGSAKALLDKHFPGTGDSKHSLEKWWALELATIAQPTVKDVLDPVDSERALGLCLQVTIPAAALPPSEPATAEITEAKESRRLFKRLFKNKDRSDEISISTAPVTPSSEGGALTLDIADYEQIMKRDDAKALLTAVEVRLLQLSYRAFPLHRPMIADYQILIEQIRVGKTKGVDERLAELAAGRVALLRSAQDATDYLNWYEATQVGRSSGAFDEYDRAVEELRRPLPPRPDSLSRLLDDLDKEFR